MAGHLARWLTSYNTIARVPDSLPSYARGTNDYSLTTQLLRERGFHRLLLAVCGRTVHLRFEQNSRKAHHWMEGTDADVEGPFIGLSTKPTERAILIQDELTGCTWSTGLKSDTYQSGGYTGEMGTSL